MDFYDKIRALIESETDTNVIEAIGVLELVKAELIAAAGDEEEATNG